MDINSAKNFLLKIGNMATTNSLEWLSNLGIETQPFQAKLISLFFLLLVIYLLIKFLNIGKKPLKWAIVGLFIFIAVSIVFTLV